MKTTFFGYYPPTDAEYDRLWKEGIVVLDTNVLLNLYRLPTTARDELFAVLDLLKERLWIPHQVALEFQHRRLTVIAGERKVTEEALQTASNSVNEIRKKVEALQIDKRGIGIESKPLLDDLEKANSKLVEAIKEVHNSQLDISSSDSIRDKIDSLLEGRIGQGAMSQDELNELTAKGDDRFKEKIPPGFADVKKDKNPDEATFIYDQLKYQRKFGDLILWRQLIKHVKASNIKCVLLVTADRKEDWWWREQGKTIGPHPELVREIIKQGGVELYWMYSSDQFLENASKYSTATVSSQSVAELKSVTIAPRMEFTWSDVCVDKSRFFLEKDNVIRNINLKNRKFYTNRPDRRSIDMSINKWLSRLHREVLINKKGFPDFIAIEGGNVLGFEVKYVRDIEGMFSNQSIVNCLIRGSSEIREGRLSEFTAILVISNLDSDFSEISEFDKIHELDDTINFVVDFYKITGIVVGALSGETFYPLIYKMGNNFEND